MYDTCFYTISKHVNALSANAYHINLIATEKYRNHSYVAYPITNTLSTKLITNILFVTQSFTITWQGKCIALLQNVLASWPNKKIKNLI